MALDSTVLTVGTALNRAQQANSYVQVLVQGQWISGHVLGLDGHGAILADGEDDSSVVRLELVAAVRVVEDRGDPIEQTQAGDEQRVHHMGPAPEDRQLEDDHQRRGANLPIRR